MSGFALPGLCLFPSAVGGPVVLSQAGGQASGFPGTAMAESGEFTSFFFSFEFIRSWEKQPGDQKW